MGRYKDPEYKLKWQRKRRKEIPEKYKEHAVKNRKTRRKKAYIYAKKYKELNIDKIREYMRTYNRVYYIKHKKVWEMMYWANKYLKDDIFLKFNNMCTVCGSNNKLEMHHDKYTKNIKDIRLLCMKCHRAHHNNKKMKIQS